jgi:hypothetical protein
MVRSYGVLTDIEPRKRDEQDHAALLEQGCHSD